MPSHKELCFQSDKGSVLEKQGEPAEAIVRGTFSGSKRGAFLRYGPKPKSTSCSECLFHVLRASQGYENKFLFDADIKIDIPQRSL